MTKDLTVVEFDYSLAHKEEKKELEVSYRLPALQKYDSWGRKASIPGYWIAILLDNDDRQILVDEVLINCVEVRVHQEQMYEHEKVCIREMIMDSVKAIAINRWHLARFVLEKVLKNGNGAIYRLKGENETFLK